MNSVVQKKVPTKKKPAQRAAPKKKQTSVYTKKELKDLSASLKGSINPIFLSEKEGYSGEKVIGFEVWRLIDCANTLFGFNGWSHSVSEQVLDFIHEHDGLFDSGVCSLVKVVLKDGAFHEEIGYGRVENAKSRAEAMEKARKHSSSDGLIQAFRHFGSAVGNILQEPMYAAPASNFIRDLASAQGTSVATIQKEKSDLEAASSSSHAQFVPAPVRNHVENADLPGVRPPKIVLYKETGSQTNGPSSDVSASTQAKATRGNFPSSTQKNSVQASAMQLKKSIESSPKRLRMADVQSKHVSLLTTSHVQTTVPVMNSANSTPSHIQTTVGLLSNSANTTPVSQGFSSSKLPVSLNTSGSNESNHSFSTVPSNTSPAKLRVPSATSSRISSSPLSAQVNEISEFNQRLSSSFKGDPKRSSQEEERLSRIQRAKAQREETLRKYIEHLQTQEKSVHVNLDARPIKVEPRLPSPTLSRNIQSQQATDQTHQHLQSQDSFVLLDAHSIKKEPGLPSPPLYRNIEPRFTADQNDKGLGLSYLQFK